MCFLKKQWNIYPTVEFVCKWNKTIYGQEKKFQHDISN